MEKRNHNLSTHIVTGRNMILAFHNITAIFPDDGIARGTERIKEPSSFDNVLEKPKK